MLTKSFSLVGVASFSTQHELLVAIMTICNLISVHCLQLFRVSCLFCCCRAGSRFSCGCGPVDLDHVFCCLQLDNACTKTRKTTTWHCLDGLISTWSVCSPFAWFLCLFLWCFLWVVKNFHVSLIWSFPQDQVPDSQGQGKNCFVLLVACLFLICFLPFPSPSMSSHGCCQKAEQVGLSSGPTMLIGLPFFLNACRQRRQNMCKIARNQLH